MVIDVKLHLNAELELETSHVKMVEGQLELQVIVSVNAQLAFREQTVRQNQHVKL